MNNSKKYAMFVGRWQPLHKGHMWLINQKLDKNIPVLICVRDIAPDISNPLTTQQTVEILEAAYKDHEVVVQVIPDVESVNYGRGVGYSVEEHKPPSNIEVVSATEIRNRILNKDDSWKEYVHPSVSHLVQKYLVKQLDGLLKKAA